MHYEVRFLGVVWGGGVTVGKLGGEGEIFCRDLMVISHRRYVKGLKRGFGNYFGEKSDEILAASHGNW